MRACVGRVRGVLRAVVPCVVGCVADLLRVWAQAIVAAQDGGPVKKKSRHQIRREGGLAWQRVWE